MQESFRQLISALTTLTTPPIVTGDGPAILKQPKPLEWYAAQQPSFLAGQDLMHKRLRGYTTSAINQYRFAQNVFLRHGWSPQPISSFDDDATCLANFNPDAFEAERRQWAEEIARIKQAWAARQFSQRSSRREYLGMTDEERNVPVEMVGGEEMEEFLRRAAGEDAV